MTESLEERRRRSRSRRSAVERESRSGGGLQESARLPGRLWGDRQRESVQEMLTLMPVIRAVAGLPPAPSARERSEMTDEQVDRLLHDRLTALLKARRIVADRLRREL